jgi:hypothetical protein
VSAVSIALADRLGPVSPELALVDPELRKRLQALEQARCSVLRPPPRLRKAAEPPEDNAPDGQLQVASGPRTIPFSRGRPGLTVVALACAAAFVLGAKVAGPSDLTPAQATGSASTAQLLPPSDLRGTVNRSPQRLAWAPVAGATGYEVALYKESNRVFVTHTTLPSVELSRTVRQTLPHGLLAWYVWPIRAGLRDPSPVVRSQLSLAP